MTAREDLYAAVMAGGEHSPDRSEKASARIDAYRAEVLREAADVLIERFGITNAGAAYLRKIAKEDPK